MLDEFFPQYNIESPWAFSYKELFIKLQFMNLTQIISKNGAHIQNFIFGILFL